MNTEPKYSKDNPSTQQSASSAEIDLIRMELRMIWVDAIMIDPQLSGIAKAAAAAIGTRFEQHIGYAIVGYDEVAALIGVTVRSAREGVAALERRGWILHRGWIPITFSDMTLSGKGRRHLAGVYLPAIAAKPLVECAQISSAE